VNDLAKVRECCPAPDLGNLQTVGLEPLAKGGFAKHGTEMAGDVDDHTPLAAVKLKIPGVAMG
jgi:hypothetical protein